MYVRRAGTRKASDDDETARARCPKRKYAARPRLAISMFTCTPPSLRSANNVQPAVRTTHTNPVQLPLLIKFPQSHTHCGFQL